MHHGVIFSFGSAKVCSPAIFETCFSLDKAKWIAATDYDMYLSSLLLNCLVLILHIYIHFLSLKHNFSTKHYLDLYINDTALKVSRSLYCFITSISHGVEN